MTRRTSGLVLLLSLALTGCATIPDSGPVIKGDRIGTLGSDVSVRVIARPPSSGMSAEALVRGFLSASASLAEGDQTAKLYLTDQAAKEWQPLREIRVYDAAALTVKATNDVVRVSAPLLGSLASDRRYTVAEPGAAIADDLRLDKVDGEWRISEAPKAVYLSQVDLQRSYRVHALFFLNDAMNRVVPEFVLLPMSTPDIPTALVRLLLAGPKRVGAHALRTALPIRTTIAYGGVRFAYGIATVPLRGNVLMASDAAKSGMLAQIAWTLRQLPYISSVSVDSDGSPMYPQSAPASIESFNPSAGSAAALTYVRDGEAIVSVGGQERHPLTGYVLSEAVQTSDGALTVGVAAGRKLLFVERGLSAAPVASGSDIASPAVTDDGAVWFLDRQQDGGLFRWTADEGVVPVDIAAPARSRVLDFSIAPDGTRIALVVSLGATASLRLGYIHQSGGTFTVDGLHRVEQQLTSVSGVAWMDDATLVVLGAVGTMAVQPVSITLPLGTATMLGGPANALSLSVVPGAPLVVADQAGQLWHFDAGMWTASELGTAPKYGN